MVGDIISQPEIGGLSMGICEIVAGEDEESDGGRFEYDTHVGLVLQVRVRLRELRVERVHEVQET